MYECIVLFIKWKKNIKFWNKNEQMQQQNVFRRKVD